MKSQALYKELAKYYDLIYFEKDYKKESNRIKQLILKYKKTKGKELLDVACGTGKHLKYLRSSFSCMGVDINKEILNIAKKNVKGVPFKQADMIKLDLNKKFDIIICLFSSIGYVKTYNNLKKTINNFYNHLKKGGVVIIDGWLTPSKYKTGSSHMTTYDKEDTKVVRVDASKKKGKISILDLHYLVAEKNKGVKYFRDRHELGLFEVNKTLKIMKDTGFKARFLKRGIRKDRELYIGIKI